MATVRFKTERPIAAFDIECYRNYFFIGIRTPAGKTVGYELSDRATFDSMKVRQIMRKYTLVGFNSRDYDMMMLLAALSGMSNTELKDLSDEIIKKRLKPWDVERKHGIVVPVYVDHVDLFDTNPSVGTGSDDDDGDENAFASGSASLKTLAGRMHCKRLQDLPIEPDAIVTHAETDILNDYCVNSDCVATLALWDDLAEPLALRESMGEVYNTDFRSLSDAQMGERMIKIGVERLTNERIQKATFEGAYTFRYEVPDFVRFETPEMQQVLETIRSTDIQVTDTGSVPFPAEFKKFKIIIGGNEYTLGIGGLHSQEKQRSHYEDEDHVLCDNDVRGYYPRLIIASKREPENMRGHFQPVYIAIVDERDAAKAAGNKTKAEQGKITSNGLFGKAGSPYSIVYAPRLLIQTTVTGQLSLLMLIEECELRGWRVVSANTDGFVTLVPRNERGMFRSVIFDWEVATGLSMEETFYKSIHSQSVNSYVAFKKEQNKDGTFSGKIEIKRKGKFAHSGRGLPAAFGLKKTPDCEISYDAAAQFLLDGTSIESTIRNCQDIRKFVSVRNVKGGAEQDDVWIGKVVRYYYSVESPGPLTYVSNGNRVPKSDGAMPCMTLPDELPGDIDYEFYEREAYAILDDCGVDSIDPSLEGRTGHYYGRREDQKTFHLVDASTATAMCGVVRKSRRDPWIEYASVPQDARFCAKCRKTQEL